MATLDLGDETLRVVGVHLSYHDSATTDEQTQDLLSRLAGHGPVIVAGDFNALSDSPAVRRCLSAGLVDSLPGDIDHCLLPADDAGLGWKLEKAAWTFRPADLEKLVGQATEISDHAGILVDLRRQRALPR